MKFNKTFFVVIATGLIIFCFGIHKIYAQNNLVEDLMITATEEKKPENATTEETMIEQTKTGNQYFDINLIRGGQSAFTGMVTYTVQIISHIDSPRTQLQWSSPTALKITPRHKEFINMQKEGVYTIKAAVKPERGGIYPITFTAISWQHDTNYTNSASDDITFNNALVLQPVSQSYIIGNIVKYLLIFLVAGGVIWGVIKVVKKYTPKAKQWLTPPV